MSRATLSHAEEVQLARLLELARTLTPKRLCARFGCSPAILHRIKTHGPREAKGKP